MGQLFSARYSSDARLDGKTAVITGANTGIGKETAKDFFIRGARVILACRNVNKGKEAIEDIRKQCEGQQKLGELILIKLDLSSLKSVRECASRLLKDEDHIDILVNNAGIIGVPYTKTEDGFEMTFQTNYLGHFLFTLLLMPILMKSSSVRIVNISSSLHEALWSPFTLSDLNFENRKYGAIRAYSETKVCNILFTKELAKRLKDSNIKNIKTYAVHPGAVKTEAGRYLDDTYFRGGYKLWAAIASLFYKTAKQGAQTTIYCSVDPKCAEDTGLYYAECKRSQPSRYARDEKLANDLWDLSLKYLDLGEGFNPFNKL